MVISKLVTKIGSLGVIKLCWKKMILKGNNRKKWVIGNEEDVIFDLENCYQFELKIKNRSQIKQRRAAWVKEGTKSFIQDISFIFIRWQEVVISGYDFGMTGRGIWSEFLRTDLTKNQNTRELEFEQHWDLEPASSREISLRT